MVGGGDRNKRLNVSKACAQHQPRGSCELQPTAAQRWCAWDDPLGTCCRAQSSIPPPSFGFSGSAVGLGTCLCSNDSRCVPRVCSTAHTLRNQLSATRASCVPERGLTTSDATAQGKQMRLTDTPSCQVFLSKMPKFPCLFQQDKLSVSSEAEAVTSQILT